MDFPELNINAYIAEHGKWPSGREMVLGGYPASDSLFSDFRREPPANMAELLMVLDRRIAYLDQAGYGHPNIQTRNELILWREWLTDLIAKERADADADAKGSPTSAEHPVRASDTPTGQPAIWQGERVHNYKSFRVHAIDPEKWDHTYLIIGARYKPVGMHGGTICGQPFNTLHADLITPGGTKPSGKFRQMPEDMRQLALGLLHGYTRTTKPVTCGNCLRMLRARGYIVA